MTHHGPGNAEIAEIIIFCACSAVSALIRCFEATVDLPESWAGNVLNANPRIDDAAAVAGRQCDDRVEIELGDLVNLVSKS